MVLGLKSAKQPAKPAPGAKPEDKGPKVESYNDLQGLVEKALETARGSLKVLRSEINNLFDFMVKFPHPSGGSILHWSVGKKEPLLVDVLIGMVRERLQKEDQKTKATPEDQAASDARKKDLIGFLNKQDGAGDTILHLALRHDLKMDPNVVRSHKEPTIAETMLMGKLCKIDIPNKAGERPLDMIWKHRMWEAMNVARDLLPLEELLAHKDKSKVDEGVIESLLSFDLRENGGRITRFCVHRLVDGDKRVTHLVKCAMAPGPDGKPQPTLFFEPNNSDGVNLFQRITEHGNSMLHADALQLIQKCAGDFAQKVLEEKLQAGVKGMSWEEIRNRRDELSQRVVQAFLRQTDRQGRHCLILAACNGNATIINATKRAGGADLLFVPDKKGMTPMHHAIVNNNPESVTGLFGDIDKKKREKLFVVPGPQNVPIVKWAHKIVTAPTQKAKPNLAAAQFMKILEEHKKDNR